MRAENGPQAPYSFRFEEFHTFSSHNEVNTQCVPDRRSWPRPSAVHARFDDVLPLNDFLKDVAREKNRAERARTTLSLVVFEPDEQKAQGPRDAEQLLEILHAGLRKTDILGHVGDNRIAVLCPDTDEPGSRAFMHKIGVRAGALAYTAVAATYPDALFDSLAQGSCTPPPWQLVLASQGLGKKSGGYPLKRGLDIAGALLALGLFGPLMLLAAAAIAWSSPGPVIFRQTRLGRGGVPFTFYKFRSMSINVDDAIHREFVARLIKTGKGDSDGAAGTPSPYKLQSDPRVTRMGRVMRKTSIDELPQLFNVLKGDMSLVGPRPPIPYEAAHYQPWHLQRILDVQPGITGLWQVEGRSKVTFNEMVRMDLRYLRDCSLLLDIRILLKTALRVIRCEGAS